MADAFRDPRLHEVPEDLRELVAECQRRRGTAGAARAIGIGRQALLAVLAGTGIQSGTLCLLREYARRAEASRDLPLPLETMSIDDVARRGGFGGGGVF